MIDWASLKDFAEWEFRCSYTGNNKMQPEFMQKLQEIRNIFGKAMTVSSGYRDFTHPLERVKKEPGEHTYGVAADINVWGVDAMELFDIAYHCGIRRLGLNQTGALSSRFIHIGLGNTLNLGFKKALWTY